MKDILPKQKMDRRKEYCLNIDLSGANKKNTLETHLAYYRRIGYVWPKTYLTMIFRHLLTHSVYPCAKRIIITTSSMEDIIRVLSLIVLRKAFHSNRHVSQRSSYKFGNYFAHCLSLLWPDYVVLDPEDAKDIGIGNDPLPHIEDTFQRFQLNTIAICCRGNYLHYYEIEDKIKWKRLFVIVVKKIQDCCNFYQVYVEQTGE